MKNPLVEHLRKGADAAGGGAIARARRLLSPGFRARQRLRLRQRPVIRICLGLVAAFFCGIALGVGVAAMIAPGPAVYTVAGASPDENGGQRGTDKDGEPVVAVSVREEKAAAARRRPLTLVDIDPISGAEAALAPMPVPTHVSPPDSPDAAPDVARTPPASVLPVPGDSSKSVPPPVADDKTSAKETPAAQAAVSPGVSFEGARSVAEAARGEGVPRAHVALGPLLSKTVPTEAPSAGGMASPGTAGAPESAGDASDFALPPHPPEKNLQLAALPMLRSPAWIRNAVAVPDKPRDAMIAMIIDDMGIDQKRSKAIIGLPGPLTLSFIPYGYHLDELVASARGAGHEIMLHQPMEPIDPEADPGPNALRTTVSIEENRRRLLWSFTRLEGIVGLNNHMGSRFTAWTEGMEMVMEEVSARGLLFVDSITNNESVAYRVAREHKLPSASRDVFIDHDISREAIEKSLQALESVARQRGYAVGIAHPHDRTREALRTWMLDARTRGFDFVPISHIVRQRMKSG